ncbi:MAG: hypothetical protein ABEJ57_06895 [Halobacteriaceae archaeon]
MASFTPLPLVDDFLLSYNVGQALLLLFVLAILGSLPLKSRKVLSANLILFGVIFLLTPSSLVPLHYKYLGIALLVVSPVLYTTARS